MKSNYIISANEQLNEMNGINEINGMNGIELWARLAGEESAIPFLFFISFLIRKEKRMKEKINGIGEGRGPQQRNEINKSKEI